MEHNGYQKKTLEPAYLYPRTSTQPREFIKREEEKEQEWSKLALTSFAEDWENDKDAIYDGWRKHYRVQSRYA